MNAPFATALAGWKASPKNKLAWPLVPNVADVDSAESMRIAAGVLDALGVSRDAATEVPKDPGGPLEQAVCDQLRGALPGYRTGRDWLECCAAESGFCHSGRRDTKGDTAVSARQHGPL